MDTQLACRLLADAILTWHLALVGFVIAGLVLVVVGNRLRWRWVNGLCFRLAHLATIAIVVAESWLDIPCPLTVWEMALRQQAQQGAYAGSFIEHWLQRLLYYEAPAWVFVTGYTLFGAMVVAVWIWFPPERWRRGKRRDA